MSKKLKNFLYSNKAEFIKDLDLIWSNCLEYNSIPESIYRKHALSMKKKSAELLEKVPEIQVLNASEVDEVESQAERNASIEPSMQSIISDQLPSFQIIPKEEELEIKDKMEIITENLEDYEEHPDGMEVDVPHLQEMREDVTYESCVITRKWKQVTTDFRACKLRQIRQEQTLPFGERHAILRNERSMESYVVSEHNAMIRKALRHLKFDLESNISLPEQKSFCFPELFHVAGTFPNSYVGYPEYYESLRSFFSWQDHDERTIPVAPLPSLSEYDQSYVNTNNQLASCMSNNIIELKLIKEVHSKILQYQNHAEDAIPDLPASDAYAQTWKQCNLPPFLLNDDTALHLVNKSCGMILSHQGFDGTSSLALATLSDIMVQLLITAGKTIKAFTDQFGNEMNMEEILVHSLEELGVQDPIELQHYINHDVVRYGRKLRDLRRRLDFAWNDAGVKLNLQEY
jgi:transcriptional activator SPT7